MSFDSQRFVHAFAIPYQMTDAGRGGWLNICCPFCREGDQKYKLGINPKGYANCWRCGARDVESMISTLLGVKRVRAKEIAEEFEGGPGFFLPQESLIGPEKVDPPGKAMAAPHRQYLVNRGFDPDWLALEYGLLGTDPREEWEGKFFGNRIIVPIHDRFGRLVSFQGRDITGESKMRYKGCPVELSPLHYKRTLYGQSLARAGRIVVVEGIFHQWRLGRGSVATFGTDITKHQLRLLAEYEFILFAFDSEPEAQGKAMKHARELAAMGKQVEVVDLELGAGPDGKGRDIADLSEEEVGPIRAELELI